MWIGDGDDDDDDDDECGSSGLTENMSKDLWYASKASVKVFSSSFLRLVILVSPFQRSRGMLMSVWAGDKALPFLRICKAESVKETYNEALLMVGGSSRGSSMLSARQRGAKFESKRVPLYQSLQYSVRVERYVVDSDRLAARVQLMFPQWT